MPARLGPFVCGLIFAAAVFLSGHFAAGHRKPLTAILIALGGLLISSLAGMILMGSTSSLRVWRLSSTNLIAVRKGSTAPRVWLVAHIDSKSQTIGMLVRVGSVMLSAFLFTLMIVVMAMQAFDPLDDVKAIQSGIISGITIVAAIPFILCFITNSSRGALDNASGVAAVLGAAEAIPVDKNIGVVITSAEELALAGSIAFAAARSERGIAINCDTIDRSGEFVCMTSGTGSAARSAVVAASKRLGQRVGVRRMIPGILTDSVSLAKAGWDTCTLSRGNLGTLARVHTTGDEPGRIDGTGIALAARILAATVEELT